MPFIAPWQVTTLVKQKSAVMISDVLNHPEK